MFLNGVEIWRIGRQKDEFVSAFLKDPPGFLSFVKGGIVHDDQGAGLKILQELFLEVGSAEKHLALTQATDIIHDSFKPNPPEGSQSARFCGAPPAKACSFAWRFC